MPQTTHDNDSAAQAVRAALDAAGRRRRARDVSRRIWRSAPIAAAVALVAAGGIRLAGAGPIVAVAALAVGVVAAIGYALVARRPRPVSDAMAMAIDADAGLRGELRSAGWFARAAGRNDWAQLHVTRAAERIQAIDWSLLYPGASAFRAKVVTAAFLAGAAALSLAIPERQSLLRPAAATAATVSRDARKPADPLDAELQQQLAELLAAAASGSLPDAEGVAANAELRELLQKLGRLTNAELLKALQRAMAEAPPARTKAAAANLQMLAERARRAADAGTLSKEMTDALEKLSDEVELARSQDGQSDEASESAAADGPQQGDAGQSSASSGMEEVSIQFAKGADAGGGAGIMMSSPDAQQGSGPPGAGVGGAGGEEAAASDAGIEAALKRETIEASQDNAGQNVETDIRRKTEHGDATVSYTGSAAAAFDRSRAAAPPPVPEGRRAGVQTYFIRK